MFWGLMKMWGITVGLLLFETTIPNISSHPDLISLLMVPWTMRSGRFYGGTFGFGAGLLLGVMGSGQAGLFAILYGTIGYLLGIWGEREHPSLFMEMLGIIFSTVTVFISLSFIANILPWIASPSALTMRNWLIVSLVVDIVAIWPFRYLVLNISGDCFPQKASWYI